MVIVIFCKMTTKTYINENLDPINNFSSVTIPTYRLLVIISLSQKHICYFCGTWNSLVIYNRKSSQFYSFLPVKTKYIIIRCGVLSILYQQQYIVYYQVCPLLYVFKFLIKYFWWFQGSADSNYSQPSSELSLDEDKEASRREKESQALVQLDKARVRIY